MFLFMMICSKMMAETVKVLVNKRFFFTASMLTFAYGSCLGLSCHQN